MIKLKSLIEGSDYNSKDNYYKKLSSDEIEKLANLYFSVGHDGEDGEEPDSHYCWMWDGNSIQYKRGGTGNKKPEESDIPQRIYSALIRKFGKRKPNFLVFESIQEKPNIKYWYHGSPSGDLRGGVTGLHLGTFKAAKQALEARIGIKSDGSEWDGNQEYGKTLLAGKKTLKQKGIFPTGFNCHIPDDDFYPTESPKNSPYLKLNLKPAIKRYELLCPIFNKKPYKDNYANHLMARLIKSGKTINFGVIYINDSEDYKSISLVVPNGNCVKEIND